MEGYGRQFSDGPCLAFWAALSSLKRAPLVQPVAATPHAMQESAEWGARVVLRAQVNEFREHVMLSFVQRWEPISSS